MAGRTQRERKAGDNPREPLKWERIPHFNPKDEEEIGHRMNAQTWAEKMIEGHPQEVWIVGVILGKPGKQNWEVLALRYGYQIDEDCGSGAAGSFEEAAAAAETFIAALKAKWRDEIENHKPGRAGTATGDNEKSQAPPAN